MSVTEARTSSASGTGGRVAGSCRADGRPAVRPARRRSRRCARRIAGGARAASLERGRFILGPEVAAFEQEFAAYVGAAHAIGVANGTEAITIALRALGVGPGDEVVVPSFTFYASAEAIPPTGATPVFCDVDPATFCVTPETVRAALTPRTKAVIAVHLFGNVAPVAEIEALGVPVARGRRAGRGLDRAGRARRARWARSRRSPSTRPRTSAPSATAARSRPTTTRSPSACGRCASTARATRSPTSRSATTRASTSCRPRCCASMLPELDAGPRAAAPPARAYAEAGLGELVDAAAGRRAGARPRLAPLRHPPRARRRARARRSRAAASAPRPTTARPSTASRRWPHWGAGVELPGTDEAARTHLALPMCAALTREQVDEVVGAVRDARLGRPH